MKAPNRRAAETSGRSSKGFLFLILLGMFFVLFVLPTMKKRNAQPAPTGPGAGGMVDGPNNSINPGGSILPAPNNRGGPQGLDWNLEKVDIGGTKPANAPSGINIDNFGKGGAIQLPGQNPGGLPSGITIPDGRTPGFNPNPGIDTTVERPARTEKGDWSIEEVETTEPASSSSGRIEPIQRTKPGQKTTKGDWSIETK